ncbi:MAG: ATP-binding cassette domain-containing protein, partial [Opitutaceae bacterium]
MHDDLPPVPNIPPPLLEVRNLRVAFSSPDGVVSAVQNISFSIPRGRTLALVGESGSGKTVTANSILKLVTPPGQVIGGRILLRSQREGEIDIGHLDEKSGLLFKVRGGLVSMIFQEPTAALSPVHTIGSQIDEAILAHQDVSAAAARRLTLEMLHKVGIADAARRYGQYPHELSGGLRQRIVIAMALVCRPELLIADEPTTALDTTLQAQILGLIKNLQCEIGCSMLLITHDFGVVAQMADEVAVMQRGEIVERGPVRTVLRHPQHAHTRALLDALPSRRATAVRVSEPLAPPSLADSPPASLPPAPPLLSVRGLCKHFPAQRSGFFRKPSGFVQAVDNVSFDLAPGETLGLVGESG